MAIIFLPLTEEIRQPSQAFNTTSPSNQDIKQAVNEMREIQNTIIARLEKLEVNYPTAGRMDLDRLTALEAAQLKAEGEQESLATRLEMVQMDYTLKLKAMKLAKDEPAGVRLSNTAELLEQILFNLPFRDLLLSQRVSSQFKAVIAGSNKLQRALFFLPQPAYDEPRLNGFLFSQGGMLSKLNLVLDHSVPEGRIVSLVKPLRSGKHLRVQQTSIGLEESKTGYEARILLLTGNKDDCTGTSVHMPRENACQICTMNKAQAESWQRMYLAQVDDGIPCTVKWTVNDDRFRDRSWTGAISGLGTFAETFVKSTALSKYQIEEERKGPKPLSELPGLPPTIYGAG